MNALSAKYRRIPGLLARTEPASALLARLVIGSVFVHSGWGKLTHLDKVIEFFRSLGIPAPGIQAPFAASTELVCGALVLLGLGTRLASIPLIAVMLVAIRTAKWEDVTGLSSFLDMPEFLYIALLLWLISRGAGPLSIDHLAARRLKP